MSNPFQLGPHYRPRNVGDAIGKVLSLNYEDTKNDSWGGRTKRNSRAYKEGMARIFGEPNIAKNLANKE